MKQKFPLIAKTQPKRTIEVRIRAPLLSGLVVIDQARGMVGNRHAYVKISQNRYCTEMYPPFNLIGYAVPPRPSHPMYSCSYYSLVN